jgi:uncharacterized heparinase superfamily protein
MTAADSFRFLNLEARCATARDWNDPCRAALWTYLLHYFDDLNSQSAEQRRGWHRELLQRWIAENPPGTGPGWDPYPVSRRIINWVKWQFAGNELSAEIDHSLAVQMRWLARRLEVHLLGNHLLANAKALVFAGGYFGGAEGDRYLAQGLGLLREQLREQVLADGGHFELSTMYHAATLEDLLDVLNLLQAIGHVTPEEWWDAAGRMWQWLAVMSHPDGGISFFNDAALGVAPDVAELAAYAARLGRAESPAPPTGLRLLRDSGYGALCAGDLRVLADCAAVGPDYLPAHGHADTLSFELSVGAQRVIVNSGTSQYGNGLQRQRERGTAAHNTVSVDGRDSSEVWGGFRVARRARVSDVRAESGVPVRLQASHDGYRRLPGRNVHTRRWTLVESCLTIEDHLSGTCSSAEAHFHLHPAIGVSRSGDRVFDVNLGSRGARLSFESGRIDLRRGHWHPRFGESVSNQHLVASLADGALVTRFELI